MCVVGTAPPASFAVRPSICIVKRCRDQQYPARTVGSGQVGGSQAGRRLPNRSPPGVSRAWTEGAPAMLATPSLPPVPTFLLCACVQIALAVAIAIVVPQKLWTYTGNFQWSPRWAGGARMPMHSCMDAFPGRVRMHLEALCMCAVKQMDDVPGVCGSHWKCWRASMHQH